MILHKKVTDLSAVYSGLNALQRSAWRVQRGVWEGLFRVFAQRGRSTETQMIDSTHVKALIAVEAHDLPAAMRRDSLKGRPRLVLHG
jgi:DNA-directed RNA polymerase